MKKVVAALSIGLAGLALGVPVAGGADGSGSKYYVAKYDGLSAARSVMRVQDGEVTEIINVLRVKCDGPNTRLLFAYPGRSGLDGSNEFEAARKISKGGRADMKGRLVSRGGSGVLRASFEHLGDGRKCATGRATWHANRVTLEKYQAVRDHVLNRDRKVP